MCCPYNQKTSWAASTVDTISELMLFLSSKPAMFIFITGSWRLQPMPQISVKWNQMEHIDFHIVRIVASCRVSVSVLLLILNVSNGNIQTTYWTFEKLNPPVITWLPVSDRRLVQMGVSSSSWGVPPNGWMVYSGKYHRHGWFWGSPISGNLHILTNEPNESCCFHIFVPARQQ